jgi:AMP-polyphosphate phosphotransferase
MRKMRGAAMKPREGRLAALDLGEALPKPTYKRELAKLQLRLTQIQQAYLRIGQSAVIVFEGWDAAGKGGTIRRMSAGLDPRGCKVWPIGAPREYFAERHYLARFWDKLPPRGSIAIFDRSWYGRVLVERVEGLAPPDRWRAAYDEIAGFERLLLDDGLRIVKVFFFISQEEQLRRFEERLRVPHKRWKLSYEDFRNRARWHDYVEAAEEMFARTDQPAPWTVISSEDKRHGRITAMKTIVEQLSAGIDLAPPSLDEAVLAAAVDHLDLEPDLVRSLAGRTD